MKTYILNLFPLLFEGVEQRIIDKYDACDDIIDTREKIESFDVDDNDHVDYNVVVYNNAIVCDDNVLSQFPFANDVRRILKHANRIIISRVDKRFIGDDILARVSSMPNDTFTYEDDRLKRIAIIVPVYERVTSETLASLYNLITPRGYECELVFVKGYTCAVARNNAVRQLMTSGPYAYTFWVDSDVIVPQNALQVLIRANADVATAWYVKKIEQGDARANVTELYGPDKLQQRAMVNILEGELPQNTLIRILACGFGATLVRGDVYERLTRDDDDGAKQCEIGDWFHYTFDPQSVCSEDIDFCVKCMNKHMSIVCDTSLRCAHIGQHVF